MATWTNIPDSVLEPGKPARSVDALALRDNPIAIAEGATGAPRIQTAAISNLAVTAAKLATGNSERDWVLGRVAGSTAKAVGTYTLAFKTGAQVLSNGVVSGSELVITDASGEHDGGSAAGTWRVMSSRVSSNSIGILVRIS